MNASEWPAVRLAYGKEGLTFRVPPDAEVIEPRYVPGLPDETAAIVAALRAPMGCRPLREQVRAGQRVVIVHTDITRATPNRRLLPPLLAELESAGIARADITLLNALGTHRPQTPAELSEMLGPDIVARYRCLQHDGNDNANLVHVGRSSLGHDIRLNRQFMEADIKILTGFIEPHFFAGFSGGPKGVLPSIAGAESVVSNHSARMVGDPRARWGVTRGNPIWEEMLEAARLAKPDLLLNVTLNRDKQITGVFAGELLAAHEAGCRFVRDAAMVPVKQPFDIVVTSNSGYPLDLNLYQAVKGMSAAAQVVREGGVIIAAAQCWDGVPEFGEFGRLLRESGSPAELLACVEAPGFSCPDQWQVQILSRIQLKAEVHVYAEGLGDDQLRQCHLHPCRDIESRLRELTGDPARGLRSVCVMPEGPLTIPYLA